MEDFDWRMKVSQGHYGQDDPMVVVVWLLLSWLWCSCDSCSGVVVAAVVVVVVVVVWWLCGSCSGVVVAVVVVVVVW